MQFRTNKKIVTENLSLHECHLYLEWVLPLCHGPVPPSFFTSSELDGFSSFSSETKQKLGKNLHMCKIKYRYT